MDKRYILQDHEAVPVTDYIEWTKSFNGNRHVCDTTINGVRISTVFLGIDHSFCGGPPLLFETMVFGGQLDQEMDRYTTWEQAEYGHKAMVDKVKATFLDVTNA